MSELRRLIERAAEMLTGPDTENRLGDEYVRDVAMYDAALTVVLTTCTSRRIEELHQLRMSDLKSITERKPVFLHIKGRAAGTVRCDIVPNAPLLACMDIVVRNRNVVVNSVMRDHVPVTIIDIPNIARLGYETISSF